MKFFTFSFTLLITVFCFTNTIQSQNIPTGVMPSVGDQVESQAGEGETIVEGDSGTNVTWDFSAMEPMALTEPSTVVYAEPSDTPHASAFPDANLAAIIPTDNGDVYSYYLKENNELYYLGGASFGTFIYFDEDPQLVLDGDQSGSEIVTDEFVGYTDIPGSPSFTNGIQDFEIDATGTLIMPSGTYDNAVRMVNTVERVDSSGTDMFSFITRLETTSYMWMIPGQVSPVMTIVYSEGESESVVTGQTPVITEIPLTKSIVYNPSPEVVMTSVSDQSHAEDLSVQSISPNPTRNIVNVMLELTATEEVQFTVRSLLGNVIISETALLSSGTAAHQLDFENLPNGTYLLSISTKEDRITRQVVKTN